MLTDPLHWRPAMPQLGSGYFAWHLRGPWPQPAVDMARRMLQEQASQGVGAVNTLWAERIEATRRALAAFVGVGADGVALTQNTSTAMGLLAWGWPLAAGDEVLLGEEEYPGSLLAWRQAAAARGLKLRCLKPDAHGHYGHDHLLAQVGPHTRLVVLSLVVFRTGEKLPVEELALSLAARHPQAALLVDGVQGLGPWRLNVTGAGLAGVVGDGRKWLLGPDGTGFVALNPEWAERVTPTLPGPRAIVQNTAYRGDDPQWLPGALRLENGALNSLGFCLLGESLNWLLATPWQALRQHQAALLEQLWEGLKGLGLATAGPMDLNRSAGLVGIVHGQEPAVLNQRLAQAGITAATRGPRLFVSVYGLTTRQEVESLLGEIA